MKKSLMVKGLKKIGQGQRYDVYGEPGGTHVLKTLHAEHYRPPQGMVYDKRKIDEWTARQRAVSARFGASNRPHSPVLVRLKLLMDTNEGAFRRQLSKEFKAAFGKEKLPNFETLITDEGVAVKAKDQMTPEELRFVNARVHENAAQAMLAFVKVNDEYHRRVSEVLPGRVADKTAFGIDMRSGPIQEYRRIGPDLYDYWYRKAPNDVHGFIRDTETIIDMTLEAYKADITLDCHHLNWAKETGTGKIKLIDIEPASINLKRNSQMLVDNMVETIIDAQELARNPHIISTLESHLTKRVEELFRKEGAEKRRLLDALQKELSKVKKRTVA